MTGIVREEAGEYVSIVRRNNSLSSSGRLRVFGFLLMVSLGIASGFCLMFGAWPILPFAGIEMAVLFAAFRYIERHAADYERIAIRGALVSVEVQDGSNVMRREMNRYWSHVVCENDGSRVALRSHGHEVEVGRHLSEDRRVELARELERELKAGA
jgi:uncharacterized membrane protein